MHVQRESDRRNVRNNKYLRQYTIDQRENQDTFCHGHHTHNFPVRIMKVFKKNFNTQTLMKVVMVYPKRKEEGSPQIWQ